MSRHQQQKITLAAAQVLALDKLQQSIENRTGNRCWLEQTGYWIEVTLVMCNGAIGVNSPCKDTEFGRFPVGLDIETVARQLDQGYIDRVLRPAKVARTRFFHQLAGSVAA